MKTIWLVPLEKIETRYTYEWADHIPAMIEKYCNQGGIKFLRQDNPWHYSNFREHNEPKIRLVNIEGELPSQEASQGAFINFASTNVWKSSQAKKIAEHFHNDRVQPGDVFYFTDSWNPAIIQVRYMADLLDIPVTIVGQWHAGWHDPNDFLGRKIKGEWAAAFEASLFHAIDVNLFTTEAYIKLFFSRLSDYLMAGDETRASLREKILRVGYPNSYLFDRLAKYSVMPKENIILFPHRIAPEKQLEIFKDLEATFAAEPGFEDYKFIVCQEKQLTKPEYHDLLGRSKLVFSAALQETYGIAQTEAIFAGAMSLSPDRLSYSEMYFKRFLYPSEWSLNFESYLAHKEELVKKIKEMLTQFDDPSYGSNGLLQQSGMLREHYIGDTQICHALIHGAFA